MKLCTLLVLNLFFFTLFRCNNDGNSPEEMRGEKNNNLSTIDSDACSCSDGTSKIVFKDSKGRSIILCGNIENYGSKSNLYLASEFILINCVTGENIIDNSDDGVAQYIIKIYGDSLIVSLTQYVLYPVKWNYDFVELLSIRYSFGNENELKESNEYFTFTPPKLDDIQMRYVDSLTNSIENSITANKGLYPYDEATIYVLFMGCINGNKKSDYLFRNLDSLFILDGAIAETYKEIAYDIIKDSLQHPTTLPNE